MKKLFKREISSLEGIFAFLDLFVAHQKIDESISFSLQLAVEELFTNMVKYQTKTSNDICVELALKRDRVVVELTDFDSRPYNIHNSTEYDPDQSLENRTPGGVGIHLVKKFIDEINYDYTDGTSIITLIKYLEKPHVGDKSE